MRVENLSDPIYIITRGLDKHDVTLVGVFAERLVTTKATIESGAATAGLLLWQQ